MRANRSRDTKPELALRRAVHALGLRYRVSIRPLPSLRRTADLVFTRAKVAVFLDGCFWHGCPEHHTLAATNSRYWQEKVQRNRERDQDTSARLAAAGWLVLRIWEHEDPQAAAVRVAEAVRSQRTLDWSRGGPNGGPNDAAARGPSPDSYGLSRRGTSRSGTPEPRSQRGLIAFGTKRSWVQIPPPRRRSEAHSHDREWASFMPRGPNGGPNEFDQATASPSSWSSVSSPS